MPKDGYTSITFPTWMLQAAELILPPGQNIQSYFYNKILIEKVSLKQLREIYDKWIAEHYPFGGSKPFESIDREPKNEN